MPMMEMSSEIISAPKQMPMATAKSRYPRRTSGPSTVSRGPAPDSSSLGGFASSVGGGTVDDVGSGWSLRWLGSALTREGEGG